MATANTPIHPELKPYPAAEKGMKRLVIVLDGAGKDNSGGGPVVGESDMEVELIAGATITTDGINRYRISADIKEDFVKGWGYNFWTISGNPELAMSTKMGGNEAPREEFVKGASIKIRYNSRLPVVVYCPENMECRFCIWKVDGAAAVVAEG